MLNLALKSCAVTFSAINFTHLLCIHGAGRFLTMMRGFGILLRRRELLLWFITICLLIMLLQLRLSPNLNETSDKEGKSSTIELTSQNLNSVDIQDLDQTDRRLLRYVRSHHIFLPSVLEYKLLPNNSVGYIDFEVDNAVYPLFKGKKSGIFLEVGACTGLSGSHTFRLEREFKWTGLLIECNPELLPKLKSVNRKAYISDVCLSPTSHPVKMQMTSMDNWLDSSSLGSGDLYPNYIKSNFTKFEVQTIPLYSIIASIDIAEVDLLILDVQSLELDVVKYFPFELILVKVWVIETFFYNAEQRDGLVDFMASKGYPANRVIKLSMDFVFIHKSFE